MKNCPNCGAPYTLHSRVCEYCGTVREKLPDEIRVEQELEQARMDVEQAKREFLTLRLQDAQKAQYNHITANSGIVFMWDVNNAKNIQATHKTVTPESEYTDEQFKKDVFITCSVTILSLVLAILGYFGAEHMENEILQFLGALAFFGGLMVFGFLLWSIGIVFCIVKFGELMEEDDDNRATN